MIKVSINNICAKLTKCEPLVAGMIGKLVEVSFSSEWDSLNKIAVFSNGDVTKDLLESQWNGNYIPIPHEVLAVPHRTISMGIYGYEIVDGEKVLAIPTIVAEIGKTKFGADPSDDPAADPTLPIWAQLQWEIDHFEISDEQIAIQVQAYLAEHPIEIQPATASVLGGVKVGEGLSITADGTLSAEGGGYEPPVGGIPKTDLASDVQASLEKADSALQNADIYIPDGLDTTGATDMSTVIQTAINGGAVYLPVGTYRIDTPLTFSGNKQFVCDGELVASGNGIVVYGQHNIIRVRKITAAGHSCAVIGRGGYTDTNTVKINELSGANGFEVVDEGNGTQYSTLIFKALSASNYGIYVHSTTNYVSETTIYGGHINDASKGVYLHTDYAASINDGVTSVHAINLACEGIDENGCAVEFVNASYNTFERCRLSEQTGANVLKMSGVCNYNRIGCTKIELHTVDISALSAASKGNVINGRISDSESGAAYLANIAHIDGTNGITYKPIAYKDINMTAVPDVVDGGITYKEISYENLNYIYTSVYCNNGTTSTTNIMLGREYSDMASAAFGTAVIFRVVTDYKPKVFDADGNVIFDASSGVAHSGQLIIKCVGNERITSGGDTLHVPSWEVTYTDTINGTVVDFSAYRTAAAQDIIDASKQDTIADLTSIRSGAALGATALQSVPSTYALKTDIPTAVSELTNDSGYLTLADLPIYDGSVI